jgi:hypothetical protein
MKCMALSGLLAFVISLGVAGAQSTDWQPFFYPIEAGAEPLVYEYRAANNPEQVRFLHLSSMLVRGEVALTYRWFDSNRQLTEMYTERMNEQGRTMLAYVAWHGETMLSARPLGYASLPWRIAVTDFFQWELAFDAEAGSLLWNHQLADSPSEVVFNNQPLRSIRIHEQVQYEGHSESLLREATYAQGLGLFSWTEKLGDEAAVDFQLHQVIDHAVWEATQVK